MTHAELEQARRIPRNYTLGYECADFIVYHCRTEHKGKDQYFAITYLLDDLKHTHWGQFRSLKTACELCHRSLEYRKSVLAEMKQELIRESI